jgi:hypothetical protein
MGDVVRTGRIAVTSCAVFICWFSGAIAQTATPVPAQNSAPGAWQSFLIPEGKIVYDVVNKVTWLADMNLPHDPGFRFDFQPCDGSDNEPQPCIWASGSMNYTSAEQWVKALNHYNNGNGYLGHQNWQLPTAPLKAYDCSGTGPSPYRESFAFGCNTSALGFLYHTALGFRAPNTAVPIPANTVGPFLNFQPNIYWSSSGGIAPLQVNSPGMVFDPETNVTWLADANLAAHETFGLPRCETAPSPTLCVARDGSMNDASAKQFIINMNAYNGGAGYLGQVNWALPPLDARCPLYGCGGVRNPMGNLYYNQLNFPTRTLAGTPVVPVPDIEVGPFNNLQPLPYWACLADTVQGACEPTDRGGEPSKKSEWGFSFSTGFQGTERLTASHFVAVYFVGCGLLEQLLCEGAPAYVLPAIAAKGGPVYAIPGAVTEQSTITLTNVSGSVCLRAGYCTNAAGIVTAAAGNTTAPGQTSTFLDVEPDSTTVEFNYGALLVSIEGVGTIQVFPAVQMNGLNSASPLTTLNAAAPTFAELGFPKFSIQNAHVRFIVADTYYADNSGDFVLTLQTPTAADSAAAETAAQVGP